MKQATRVKPIFIFSLPRSGSTLLQRIIGSDDKISFAGEPWLLLPLFYSIKERGALAEYNHHVMTLGLRGFSEELSKNESSYLTEIKLFTEHLYERASAKGSLYFIDKTPRYHFIIDEILKVFDDAKFIFLWRNPLAIQASCIETWCSGKWKTHHFYKDQYGGLERLVNAYMANKDRSWVINYEDLLINPELVLRPLFTDYLQIDFNPEIVEQFSKQKLKGKLGDPTGVIKYKSVDREPLVKWKSTMSNELRKHWCINYLEWIGEKRLEVMGYNIETLKNEVVDLPKSFSGIAPDLSWMIYEKAICKIEKVIFHGKPPFFAR